MTERLFWVNTMPGKPLCEREKKFEFVRCAFDRAHYEKLEPTGTIFSKVEYLVYRRGWAPTPEDAFPELSLLLGRTLHLEGLP